MISWIMIPQALYAQASALKQYSSNLHLDSVVWFTGWTFSSGIITYSQPTVAVPFNAVCRSDFYEHEYSLCFSRSRSRACFWHCYLPRARQQQSLDWERSSQTVQIHPNHARLLDWLVSCGGKRFNSAMVQWCPFTMTPTSHQNGSSPFRRCLWLFHRWLGRRHLQQNACTTLLTNVWPKNTSKLHHLNLVWHSGNGLSPT